MKLDLTQTELERLHEGDDRFLSGISDDVIGGIGQVQRRYVALFKEALRQQDFSARTAARLAEANILARQLDEFIRDAGLETLLTDYQVRHTAIMQQSMEYFTFIQEPDVLSGTSRQALTFLVDENVEELFTRIDDRFIQPLNRALIQGTFNTRPRQEIVDELTLVADDLNPHQVETLVNDSYRRFHRVTRATHAEELEFDVVSYTGPLDGKTSPQCVALLRDAPYGVDGVWLKEEFTRDIHPDIQEDPLISGGHFNCRHSVGFLSREAARRIGASVPLNDG